MQCFGLRTSRKQITTCVLPLSPDAPPLLPDAAPLSPDVPSHFCHPSIRFTNEYLFLVCWQSTRVLKWGEFEAHNGFEGQLEMLLMTTHIQICFMQPDYK